MTDPRPDILMLGNNVPVPLNQAHPDDIHEAIRTHAWVLYTAMPTLLTTDRHGNLEGGWTARLDADEYTAVPENSMGQEALATERAALARLIRAYCDHPLADHRLVRRGEGFPRSVELYVG